MGEMLFLEQSMIFNWISFALFAVIPFIAYSGIDVVLQSPLEQESEVGTIVTATFLLTNSSQEEESYIATLELPSGWVSIPFEEPYFLLRPGETRVQWVAFRIPPDALAGLYKIRYIVQGRDHPSLYNESDFLLRVPKKSLFTTSIKTPNYIIAGNSYETVLTVVNEGNTDEEIEVKVKEYAGFRTQIKDPAVFTLRPKESKCIRIETQTKITLEDTTKHFLHISVQNTLDPNSIQHISAETEIFPIKKSKLQRYHTIPMETTFGYGKKNNKTEGFVEQSGKGTLDNQKNIDFFFRIPVIKQANIDRDLGGLPENGYLHIWDSLIDLYGGDGVYALTPLILLGRFGKGASLGFNPIPVSFKALYVKDTSSVPMTAFGGSMSYEPFSFLSVTFSSLRSAFPKKSEIILDTGSRAYTHSLTSEFENKKIGSLQLDYANTGNFFSPEKHKSAYYIYSKSNYFKGFWYALQQIYAEPDFVGYYQDTNQSYASLGFPIIKKMQGTLSYNKTAYNLEKNDERGSSPRSQSAYGGFSYSFPFGLYTSLYGNYLTFKDYFSDLGYQTQFLSLNGGQTIKKWTLQGILEYGSYHTMPGHSLTSTWQNYQFYTYFQPSPKRQYAAYTRIGYTWQFQKLKWARIYGLSSAWNLGRHLNLQLMYQFSDQSYSRQYLNTNIRYTFNNKSYATLKGYWNVDTIQGSTLEFLFSYTIPWNLPVKKNKSIGHIKGQVTQKEAYGEDVPYSQLVVNCNGTRTLTDEKGNFTFPDLSPGTYHLWTDGNTKNKVSSTTLPLAIPISGGEVIQTKIRFDHPCKVIGTILMFSLWDNALRQEGAVSQVTLVLTSAATGERVIRTTNDMGSFSFEDLAPGRWLLEVLSNTIPPYHYFEPKELLIDLFPGAVHTAEIKLLPIKRQLRMIDAGTIHSE